MKKRKIVFALIGLLIVLFTGFVIAVYYSGIKSNSYSCKLQDYTFVLTTVTNDNSIQSTGYDLNLKIDKPGLMKEYNLGSSYNDKVKIEAITFRDDSLRREFLYISTQLNSGNLLIDKNTLEETFYKDDKSNIEIHDVLLLPGSCAQVNK